MAFKFRLEKVLDYRRQLEEQAMLDLARARMAREAEAAKLEGLRAELGSQRARMQDSAGLSGAERWLTQTYIQALQQDIERSVVFLAALDEEVAICRQNLVARAQERELLDKLKSKQAKRFAQEEKLREQRDYDETATIRHKQTAI